MKTIEQESCANFTVQDTPRYEDDLRVITQCGDQFFLDKQGASELIKVLQEWVDND